MTGPTTRSASSSRITTSCASKGVRDKSVLDELHSRFRQTHQYCAAMGREHARGCGIVVASKLGIMQANPFNVTPVLEVEGKIPSGGAVACKLDVGAIFPQCSLSGCSSSSTTSCQRPQSPWLRKQRLH